LLLLLPTISFAQTEWPGSNAELCVYPTTTQVRPHSTCSDTISSTSNCASSTAFVHAQIGEIEDIQLLLRKGIDADDHVGGLTDVQISFSNLPPFIHATTYRVGYVKVDHSPRYPGSGGGWRPDPLLPLSNGKSFDIPASTAQPLYVSLAVDRTAIPGQYNDGKIEITCKTSNNKACDPKLSISLSITILNVTLPELKDTRLGSAWSGSWNSETFLPYYPRLNFNETKNDWFDLMINSRMPPDSIYLTKPRDYNDYKYMHQKGVKWFAILDVSSLPLYFSGEDKNSIHASMEYPQTRKFHQGGLTGSCANYTEEYVTRMITILRPIVDQLERDNMLSSAYIYGFDENPISCEMQVRKLFGATKKAFPNLKTAAVLNWSPMPVDLPVDIWILQYEKFNATDVTQWIKAGKEQWQYHCIEPHDLSSLNTFIERPALQSRLMMWLSALNQLKYGAPTGWLYYAVNLWRPCNNIECFHNYTKTALIQNYSSPFVDFPVGNYIWQGVDNDIFANGDGQYLYPCEYGQPCGSIRLSALRDGLEDWDGLFSVASPEIATPLIEEMVRGARDWEFTGDKRMNAIRAVVANSLTFDTHS
jgi:hypothetical protein